MLLCIVLAVLAWSAIHPYDMLTWWLEVLPGMIGITLLAATYKKFPLTDLVYVLIALHCVVLFIGGHYTYTEVPWFNALRDAGYATRNHYDRVGHVMQGFAPAMVARELLLRTSSLKRGAWLSVLIILSCTGISAIYELLEWGVAEWSGIEATAFLATQGDVWDTQKDMALALAGAVAALVLLSPWHDTMLKRKGWA